MIKMIYLGVLFALTAIVLVLASLIRTKKDLVSRSIAVLFLTIVFAVVANTLFVIADNETLAVIFHSAFLASIDWMLLLMLRYVVYYTENQHGIGRLMYVGYGIAAAESVCMILNPLFHHVFVLQAAHRNGYGLYFYPTGYSLYFYIHLAYSYVIVFLIFLALIKKMRHTARLYRHKYGAVALVFLLVIIFDAIGLIWNPPIDISLLFYCGGCIVLCFVSVFYVPKAMTDKILSNALLISEMGVGCIDINGRCIYVNNRGRKMLHNFRGIDIDEDLGAAEQYFAGWRKRHWSDEAGEQTYLQNFSAEGRNYNYEFTIQRMEDEDNAFLGFFITCRDRTEDVERYEEEHFRVTHDALTGIYNEQTFEEKVAELLERYPNEPYVMVTSDIKDFKLVNDLFGSERGDEILKMQAKQLRDHAIEGDLYARTGEDHFSFCMPKCRYQEAPFAQAMQAIMDVFSNEAFRVQVNMGVYEIIDRKEPVYMMIDKCNLALATVRDDYTKHIAYFNESLLEVELEKNRIINEFEGALSDGQIQIYLQPQTTSDGLMVGAEALARWIHPTRGLIPPNDFIPVLEQVSLVHRLDAHVWNLAAAQLAKWKAIGREDISISVNISPQDQYHLDVYDVFTKLVERYDINPHLLKLEITETIFARDTKRHIDLIDRLRAYGFEVEIDDFGSGYSSLNILKDVKVDVIKIDMGFLEETENEERSRSILSSLINLIHGLHMDVITEGVETEAQVHVLSEMGCHHFQGYYFSRPIPVVEFEDRYGVD